MLIACNGKTIEVPSCGALDIYSTEEQVVGRWIDGKPVYRRVLDVVMGNINVETYHTTLEYVDFMVSNRFLVFGKGGGIVETPNTFSYIGFSQNTKKLFSRVSAGDSANQPAKAIIEYTKTTDQATIELPAAVTAAPAQLDYAIAPSSAASAVLDAEPFNEEV